MNGKCQCTTACRLPAAEGHPFALAHDKRPEMQEARTAMMSERGKRGGKVAGERKQAERVADATSINLDTVASQRAALNFVAKGIGAGTLSSRDGAVLVAAARAAQTLLRVEELEAENRELRKLISKHVKGVRK
jgi:hypothetical protein